MPQSRHLKEIDHKLAGRGILAGREYLEREKLGCVKRGSFDVELITLLPNGMGGHVIFPADLLDLGINPVVRDVGGGAVVERLERGRGGRRSEIREIQSRNNEAVLCRKVRGNVHEQGFL